MKQLLSTMAIFIVYPCPASFGCCTPSTRRE